MSFELKDRVPTRPNRKLITPEGGGTPYFATVVHADEPVEVGTPINKSTLNNILTEANAFTISRTGINAKELRPWSDTPNEALINEVPVGVTHITFIAISDFKQSDSYFLLYSNAASTAERIKLTITDLAGEPLDDGVWKTGAPVSLIIQGDKAFFKGGGVGANDTLPIMTAFKATAKNKLVHLDLSVQDNTLPVFAGTTLVRKVGSAPSGLRDGTKIEIGGAGSYDDTNVQNGVTYYYRAFPYNAKKQHQTSVLNAVVSATPKAFSLPKFTGQHAIFGDETKGRIEMYSSGTLTLSEATYDLFVVGGGGAGGAGGGGAGYTKTLKNSLLKSNYTVSIGAYESSTEIAGILSAQGGKRSEYNSGGDGGSGGGGDGLQNLGGDGGSDGGDGGKTSGGKGQGTTTRAFEEVDGTLYAGGGGGSSGYKTSESSRGGEGGGGRGSRYPNEDAVNGTPNTGGGGGGGINTTNAGDGGSGIAIIRWGY